MESRFERLSIDSSATKPSSRNPKAKVDQPIAESWEDESASESEPETEKPALALRSKPFSFPDPPPPTPASPAGGSFSWNQPQTSVPHEARSSQVSPPHSRGDDRKRPEKSIAVAGRLIAAGLGVKVPRRTDELKAYDRAVREQELKRQNREKATREKEKEEEERAESAVWET